jgi:hypothetical protein
VGLDGNGENLNPDASDLYSIVEKVMGLLDDIGDVMFDDALRRFANFAFMDLFAVDLIMNVPNSASDILPSATKILQPKDRHIVSATCFTLSSTGFTSNSEHLYNAQQLQEKCVYYARTASYHLLPLILTVILKYRKYSPAAKTPSTGMLPNVDSV